MIFAALSEADPVLPNALKQAIQRDVRNGSLEALLGPLKRQEVSAFVVDVPALRAYPEVAELIWRYAGVAQPIVIDSSRNTAEQIIIHVKQALERIERELAQKRLLERQRSLAGISEIATALLANITLASEDPNLSRATRLRLDRAKRLGERLHDELKTGK
jgi:hypothetical protein